MKKPSEVELLAMAVAYYRTPYIAPEAWFRRFRGEEAKDMKAIKANARQDARAFLRALRYVKAGGE